MYRPKPGKEKALKELVSQHFPTLKAYELVTDKHNFIAQSEDGTIIEIFEWTGDSAIDAAHQHPAVTAIWEKMAPICDFPVLRELKEAETSFPDFKVINLE